MTGLRDITIERLYGTTWDTRIVYTVFLPQVHLQIESAYREIHVGVRVYAVARRPGNPGEWSNHDRTEDVIVVVEIYCPVDTWRFPLLAFLDNVVEEPAQGAVLLVSAESGQEPKGYFLFSDMLPIRI